MNLFLTERVTPSVLSRPIQNKCQVSPGWLRGSPGKLIQGLQGDIVLPAACVLSHQMVNAFTLWQSASLDLYIVVVTPV